jgi:hypothetical protein
MISQSVHKQSLKQKHGKKRRLRNTTPRKTNDSIIQELVGSEVDESTVANVRRMMIRMFDELEEGIQK